eukprot:RCo000692
MPPPVFPVGLEQVRPSTSGSKSSRRGSSRRISALADKLCDEDLLGEPGSWYPERYQAKEGRERDSTLTPPPERRTSHYAVFWGDRLWTFGGVTTDYCDFTVHNYDPVTGLWKQLNPDGKAPQPRSGFSAVQYNNSVFLFGGSRDSIFFGDLVEYRLDSEMWQQVACRTRTVPRKRFGHSSVLSSEAMYLFGGSHKNGYLNDMWTFDFTARSWREVVADAGDEDVPEARAFHSLASHRGKLFLFGGFNGMRCLSDLWMYTEVGEVLGFGDWRRVAIPMDAPHPGPRMNHGSCALSDGRVLIFGGSNWRYNNELWVLDSGKCSGVGSGPPGAAITPVWELVAPKGAVPGPRALAAVAVDVQKSTMFVFGGTNERTKLNDMFSICFDSTQAPRSAARKPNPPNSSRTSGGGGALALNL